MRKKRLIALICVLVCVMITVVPAFAMETRASQQIKSYAMDASASSKSIDVYFLVSGTGNVTKVGCESIDIYTKSGSSWTWSTGKTESDSGMSKAGRLHTNTISFSKTTGVEYKVVVTIFAEDGDGRDTRTKTFYL